MYIQYLSITLSLFIAHTFSINPIRPHSIRTTNIGNSSHPQLFYQLATSSSANAPDYYNYGLLNVWATSAQPPSLARPINSSAVAILLSTAIYALSSLPADGLSNAYETIGPEHSERLAALDTRLIVRQYERPGVVNGSGYPPKGERMRNQEVVAAVWLLEGLYVPRGSLAPDQTRESAWWGCYLRGSWAASRCTATVMVQRELWSRDPE